MVERLFVYGSLQPGGSNAHVLAVVPGSWARARVRGRLEHRGWGAAHGYPGLVLDEEAGDVAGHVFASKFLTGLWPDLDRFEGIDYRRVQADAELEDGSTVAACVYVLREG